MDLLSHLKKIFSESQLSAFPETVSAIEIATSGHADYQCNSAMKLAKILQKPPRQIAEQLVLESKKYDTEKAIEKLEIAGPGFINIHVSSDFLIRELTRIKDDPRLGIPPLAARKVIIDFSSPNTAKEMHVGHLRSTIIGDCLARCLEFFGLNTLRLNHIGDFGTSFGMLVAYLRKFQQAIFSGSDNCTLTSLMGWYKASKELFDKDEAFKKSAQLEVVRLQQKEPDSLKCWEMISAISRKAYQEIYDLLDVKLVERGESYYGPYLSDIVKELKKNNLITFSDGAECLFLEGFKNREGDLLPLMVQKSDGGYTYDTTDLASIRHRIFDEQGDWLIYVTDAGQAIHFQMIFAAAEKAGWLNPSRTRVDHVPFGLVLGNDGKKFRTRSGETEKLIDLIDAAIKRAEALLKERGEPTTIAPILGINAIKYADLSVSRTSDYHFSYEKMLQFEGNTAAFLMYSLVRALSIMKRASSSEEAPITLSHPSERALALHLLRFHETLTTLLDELYPHRLSDYLYHLAEKFNAFFRDCRVIGAPEESSRLQLCDLVAKTLGRGLNLLGLKTVEKM